MTKKTILVTGCKGFVGGHLENILKTSFPGARIVGMDRVPCDDMPAVDLIDPAATAQLLADIRPDYLFHLAGVVYSKNWQELYEGNVVTSINVLEGLRQAGLTCRVVIAGSAAEYGRTESKDLPISERLTPNPVVPYGVAKVWQSTVARYYCSLGCEVMIGRLFNIIGSGAPEGLSVGAFANQLGKIRRGELEPHILVGNLRPKRDFLDVADACRGFIALATKGTSGEIYNICSGRSVSMQQILQIMIEHSGLDIKVTVDPQKLKSADIDDSYGSNEKIFDDTGWRPEIPVSESIAALLEHV